MAGWWIAAGAVVLGMVLLVRRRNKRKQEQPKATPLPTFSEWTEGRVQLTRVL